MDPACISQAEYGFRRSHTVILARLSRFTARQGDVASMFVPLLPIRPQSCHGAACTRTAIPVWTGNIIITERCVDYSAAIFLTPCEPGDGRVGVPPSNTPIPVTR